jgi:hypothetical protein
MDKAIVLFVEGETDLAFYNKVLSELRHLARENGCMSPKTFKKNLEGVGGFKSKATRIFANNIVRNNPKTDFVVFLCYDTDVFEYDKKPQINWKEVADSLMLKGAHKVIQVKQKKSIEDWFLNDYEGLCKYLNLQPQTKCTGKTGADKINCLFKKVNKIYIKGKTNSFIENLNINKIMLKVNKEINPLCKEFGIVYKSGDFKKYTK